MCSKGRRNQTFLLFPWRLTFLIGFTPKKAEQPLKGMKLQRNDKEKNENLLKKLFKKTPKICLLTVNLKPFRS